MLKRVSGMAFAPSMHVFPGGGVDARDGEAGLPWPAPSPAEWAERPGCTPAEAQMHVAAAVREVFEEVGVLLASPSTTGPLVDPHDETWTGVRERPSLGSCPSPRSSSTVASSSARISSWPRRTGSLRCSSRGGSTRGSSPPWCPSTRSRTATRVRRRSLSGSSLRTFKEYAAELAPCSRRLSCGVEEGAAANAAEFVAHNEDLALVMPDIVQTPRPAMRIDA